MIYVKKEGEPEILQIEDNELGYYRNRKWEIATSEDIEKYKEFIK